MTRLTKAQPLNNMNNDMPWDFSEVPKLVGRLLAGAFGAHPFKVRRNKGEQTISISWELGPTYDAVSDFVWKTFPRIGYDSEWGSREYDPPEMIDGRLLHPYFYSTDRCDLFNTGADDVLRLIAVGADIEERNERQRTPFAHAILHRHESRALALLEAGADCSCCLPEGEFCDMRFFTPALRAAIESQVLAAAVTHSNSRTTTRRL